MKTTALLFIVLIGCSRSRPGVIDPKGAVALAEDNVYKAKKYHELMGEMKSKQAAVQALVDGWKKECDARGMLLQMGQDGDPGCSPAPSAPATTPAASTGSQGLSHIDGTMAPKK